MEYIFGVIILVLVIALFLLIMRSSKNANQSQALADQMKAMTSAREADRVANVAAQQALTNAFQQQLSHLTQQLDSRLNESRRDISDASNRQMAQSRELIEEVSAKINLLTREQYRVNEKVNEFSAIGEKLANLEKTLTHQKQRGAWGERSLELILDNFLVGNYEKQYPITDKDIVDFVIKTPEGLIPVDAKFSLDNYQRLSDAEDPALREQLERDFRDDLKKRIDETAKYINEKRGTLPFAFMFIPAEAIYYDVLMNKVGRVHEQSMIDYAYQNKHVIIVSPTTFMAYLQTVLYGFKAFQVAKDAQDIIKRVGELGKHLKSYEDYHGKMGTTLGTLVNHYNHSSKQFKLVDKDIERIAKVAPGLDAPLLDKPQNEDEEE